MIEYFAKAGDTRPIEAELQDAQGIVNLTGASVKLRYRSVSGGAAVEQDADIVDPLLGTVKYTFQADELVAGSYEAEWHVVLNGGEKATFPSDQYMYLRVSEALIETP